MKIQRLKSVRETLSEVARTLYMLFGFPFLLLIGTLMFFISTSGKSASHDPDIKLGIFLIWAVIFLSVGIFFRGARSRRRVLKTATAAFRDPAYFDPDEGYEMYQQASGKYLGIDKTNGTILYIHSIRKGQMDVVALTMGEWTNCEVEGNIFRLYTKYADLPCLEIRTAWAQRWYDTLGAMQHKQYSTPKPFKQFVYDRIELLERDLKVHIPRLA
jgi:hypothetical protein